MFFMMCTFYYFLSESKWTKLTVLVHFNNVNSSTKFCCTAKINQNLNKTMLFALKRAESKINIIKIAVIFIYVL